MGMRLMGLGYITSTIFFYLDSRQQPIHLGIYRFNWPDRKAAIIYDREMDLYRNVHRIKYEDKRFTLRERLWAKKEIRDERRKYVKDRVKEFE